MHVLAVASTDSHLKWAAHQLMRAPSDWNASIVVVRGPGSPSQRQIGAAVEGTAWGVGDVPVIGLAAIRALRRARRPDVLIAACTGPVIEVLDHTVLGSRTSRPVVVAATPGLALPVTRRSIASRMAVDVFVAHSRREQTAYARAFAAAGSATCVALSRLPTTLPGSARTGAVGPCPGVLFAPQARVPASLDDRRRLLMTLIDVTPGRVTIHERTTTGETTAHRETHPYAELFAELVAERRVRRDAVEFVHGPMSQSIATASCVVTISSTTAIEAAACGVPVGVISDFGVSDDLLNTVFLGSGCLIRLGETGVQNVSLPRPEWADHNYLHPEHDDDWIVRVQRAVASHRPECPRRPVPTGGARWLARSVVRSITEPRSARHVVR